MLSLLFICALFINSTSGSLSPYSLTSFTSPSGCYGGSICLTQPVVIVTGCLPQLTDSIRFLTLKTRNPFLYVDLLGNIMGFFNGFLDVSISSTSSESIDSLYIGNCTSLTNCGVKVMGSSGRVPIINGIANFVNLQIRAAGLAYVLEYNGYDSTNRFFATAYSNPFDVNVGAPYMLAFSTYMGRATGGLPFSPNPVVEIVDRGGNSLSNLTEVYEVTVSLLQFPAGATLLPLNALTVLATQGVAQFSSLYINQTGYPYQLGFTTNAV